MFSFDNKTFWVANFVWYVANCYLYSLVYLVYYDYFLFNTCSAKFMKEINTLINLIGMKKYCS